MQWLLLAAVVSVPTVAIRAPWAAGGDGSGEQDARSVGRGAELYATGCASCHGPGGEGTGQGPPLVGVGAASVDFMLSTGRMPLADPDQQAVRGPPAYRPDQIVDLVAFVSSLGPGGEPIPTVDPSSGDLARGRELYAANCLACHGAGAQGASVGGGAVAPALDMATPRQMAEAVRIGPGAMPPFGDDVLTDEDLDSLVAYVLDLRLMEDPGGLGLGRVGPVVEGLIGWLVGMGILFWVIRATGTKR